MPDETERPIEKLLRRCAKQRRAQAGAAPELHSATRRLLQDEVARQFGQPARPGGFLPRLALLLRPRLVEGLLLVALLAVIVTVFLPARSRDKAVSLAMSDRSAPAAAAPANAPQSPALAAKAEPQASYSRQAAGSERRKLDQDALTKQKAAERPATTLGEAAVSESPAQAPAPAREEALALGAELEKRAASQTGSAIIAEDKYAPAPGVPAGGLAGGAGSQTRGLTKNSTTPPAAPEPAAPSVPAPAPAPSPPASDVTVGLALNESAGQASNRAAGTAGIARDNLNQDSALGRLAASAPAAGTFVGGSAPAGETRPSVMVQQFTRTETNSEGSSEKPAAPVLVAFQVEQIGQQLKVTDSDGSVYTGSVQLAGTPSPASAPTAGTVRTMKAAAPRGAFPSAPLSDRQGAAAQNYFFQVSGTNRSLNQQVVFSGNLTGATNPPYFARFRSTASATNRLQAAPAPPGPAPLLHSRISGKAVIGGGQEIQINALPAPNPSR